MVEITELLWDDQNIAHIGGHDVTVPEVSEVVFGPTALFFDLDRPDRAGRMAAFGVTTAGRAARHLSRHSDYTGSDLRPDSSADDDEGAAHLRPAQGGRIMTRRPAAEVDAFDEDDFDLATLQPAEVRVGREPKSALSVRFDAADIERLRDRAAIAGVGITQLVRAWVLERLDEPEPSAAVGDLMEALERSLQAARTIKRASGTQKQAG